MVVLLLTTITTFSFFDISNLQANENVISYDLAKKLNVKVSDVEFSNINENQLDRIFLSLNTNYFDTPIGIASESIETTTFTWWELLTLYNIQTYLYDLHVDKISKEKAESLTTSIVGSLTAVSLKKFEKLFGIRLYSIPSFVAIAIKTLNDQADSVMMTWLKDGRELIQRAANMNKK